MKYAGSLGKGRGGSILSHMLSDSKVKQNTDYKDIKGNWKTIYLGSGAGKTITLMRELASKIKPPFQTFK